MLSWLAHESHFWCTADVITPLACDGSGSARVPRAGEGLWRSPIFFRSATPISQREFRKVHFGATPKPARETHALPALGMT